MVSDLPDDCRLYVGDCREWLLEIPDQSIDVVLCDPPYPCIQRSYGTLTEPEWHDLMHAVVGQCRRVLKPSGSAVFILQPNSRKVGSMRLWLWEFLVWAGREWNIVQDAWWWNVSALPTAGATDKGLLKSSLKACVWLGPEDCYRDQDAVLIAESEANRSDRLAERFGRKQRPSGWRPGSKPRDTNGATLSTAAERRGGTIPGNVLPIGSDARWNGGTHGHGASTPLDLMDFWLRYLCPPGGTACDPFLGSGTTALAALRRGLKFVGGDREPAYIETTRTRLAAERARTPLLA
jgi:hypothetical protein